MLLAGDSGRSTERRVVVSCSGRHVPPGLPAGRRPQLAVLLQLHRVSSTLSRFVGLLWTSVYLSARCSTGAVQLLEYCGRMWLEFEHSCDRFIVHVHEKIYNL